MMPVIEPTPEPWPWQQTILTHENEGSRNPGWCRWNRCSMQDITSHHEVRTWSHHIISNSSPKTGTNGSPKNKHHGHANGRCVHGNHEKLPKRPTTPPARRVQFLLDPENIAIGSGHQPHPIFCEMEELFYRNGDMEWKETARY